jgi:integrase
MPKLAAPLNDTQVKNLKPKSKRYYVSDGAGLKLEVLSSGSKVWRYRYSLNRVQQPLITIGDYPAISLADARVKAKRYAALVAKGISPVADAKKDRGATKTLNSVRDFGNYWLGEEIIKLSDGYYDSTRRVLEKDIYPDIGNKALDEVNALDVMAICDKIKKRGSPQSALLTRNILKRMYSFAVARMLATSNPAQLVVARFVATPKSRTRVLSGNEIGSLLRTIYKSDMGRVNKLALHLLVLTMLRKTEVIHAEWSEIDLVSGEWLIPKERMKKDRDHLVFLPKQAIAMFEELRSLSTSDKYVFRSTRGNLDQPIAKSTLNQAIKAMSLEIQHFVLHDFRRTASTHLNDMEKGRSAAAIEKALAHSIPGVRGIYNRAEHAEERKRLLQLWADFVDAQITGDGKVVTGYFNRAG